MLGKSWLVLSVIALFILPIVVACRGGSKSVSADEVKIRAGDFYFRPDTITVKVDMPVKFVVINVGKMEHEFIIEESAGVEYAKIESIMPGTTGFLETTFDEVGIYTYGCGITGHAEAGMEGTLKVIK